MIVLKTQLKLNLDIVSCDGRSLEKLCYMITCVGILPLNYMALACPTTVLPLENCPILFRSQTVKELWPWVTLGCVTRSAPFEVHHSSSTYYGHIYIVTSSPDQPHWPRRPCL